MKSSQSPTLTRFLSDFTLGFSDGLTVPFALTAGLSSLGSTGTVISGGLAELCAGSISMGIGGYLAARDELPQPRASQQQSDVDDEEEMRGMLSFNESADGAVGLEPNEKSISHAEELLRKHLEPLNLAHDVTSTILTALQNTPGSLERAASSLRSYNESLSITTVESLPISPITSGLFISLGYTIGGIIPLIPYFFCRTVGMGFRWSSCLCLFALFAFGSGKSWALRGDGLRWRCIWEGVQMLVLGSLAAAAAVACVTLVGGDMVENKGS